jgi:hypothetical protein
MPQFFTNNIVSEGLSQLEMISEDGYTSGLVHISELEDSHSKINYSHRLALERASKVEANAVYFRNFPDERPSIPQLYIFDFTKNEGNIVEIHKKVWSNSQVRLYLVITRTEIKLFNSSKPVDVNEYNELDVKPFDVLKIAGEAKEKYEEYSAKKFDNGTFWDESKIDFGYQKTAYEKLISELKNARNQFLKKIKLSKETSNKLLVLSILIKYLEERVDYDKDGHETRVFEKEFFNRKEFGFSNNFIEVIRNGYLLPLFNYLSGHFNGKIFSLSKQQKEEIKNIDLSPLADFLSGEIDNKHYVLWRIYSFNHLPVELISSIYEVFLEADKKKGIAYTPSYLVNFMIDETMPLNKPNLKCRVIDPACGSGIFLVSAFKRLVDWWRIEYYKKNGRWVVPDKDQLNTLKELLKNNIFGVDKEGEAVDLAIFSLSLALCDILSPKVIWENLQFDDLSGNIVHEDFFKWISDDKKEQFDLVIGNPPFIEYGAKYPSINKLINDIGLKNIIPNNQSALFFTIQSIKLAKKNTGLLSFVLPSGPLLYNNSNKPVQFRKWLFSHYNIPQIIDFTYLSDVLFKNKGNKKNVAVSVFFMQNKQPDNEPISHITVKKLKSAKERQYFEIDHYDFHKVDKEIAINDYFVWKCNLLGGGRIYPFIKKLFSYQSLEEYLYSKKEKGWIFGEGFNTSKSLDSVTNEDINSERYKRADYLTGYETLPTEAFKNEGINFSETYILEDEYFYNRAYRNRKIFHAPHVLIKESLGINSIPVEYVEKYLTFRNEIVGIYAPENEKDELYKVKKRIQNNQLYRFYLINTSGRAGINKSTFPIYKQDIMALPYPGNEKDIELSKFDSVIIEDTLSYGLKLLGRELNDISLTTITDEIIYEFGNIFCEVLNSLFEENDKRYYPDKLIKSNSFICSSFIYGEKPDSTSQKISDERIEKHIAKLVIDKIGTSYRINRVVKIYEGDTIYLLKPKKLRYWLKSIALRDADETIVDLYNAGY